MPTSLATFLRRRVIHNIETDFALLLYISSGHPICALTSRRARYIQCRIRIDLLHIFPLPAISTNPINIATMRELSLDQVKQHQVNLLRLFRDFCDQNNLRYYLAYGTLLGAVRNGGYIPWDDDIDVMMPRGDYIEFVRLYNGSTFNSVSEVYDFSLDIRHSWPYAKLSQKNTMLVEDANLMHESLGVNIDIFPIDKLPQSSWAAHLSVHLISLCNGILAAKRVRFSANRSNFRNGLLAIARLLGSAISYKFILRLINRVAVSTSYRLSDFEGCAVGVYREREIMNARIFAGSGFAMFEGEIYRVPQEFDAFLTNIYGDYMILPPIEFRVSRHRFRAFSFD